MRKHKTLHNFYKSIPWKVAREIKIRDAEGWCERCGALGEEVHHKERLTIHNVMEPDVSLNQKNLELLCKKCHNKEHKRFSTSQQFDKEGNLIRSKTTFYAIMTIER